MLNSYTIEQVAFSHVRLRINSYPLNPIRNGHQGLQLFPTNKEYPVSAGQTLPLNASLPCVRTPPPSYYHGRSPYCKAATLPLRYKAENADKECTGLDFIFTSLWTTVSFRKCSPINT
uniref:Uncharacterized protein n=1 Tax=Erpetoichthys calabaricus TaxID=27687 RepID=A0A8C4SYF1_ERPCA